MLFQHCKFFFIFIESALLGFMDMDSYHMSLLCLCKMEQISEILQLVCFQKLSPFSTYIQLHGIPFGFRARARGDWAIGAVGM